MTTGKSISLLVLLLALTAGCEWPADPPLKTAAEPPPAEDTTKVLLPLDPRVNWTYVVTANVRPPQSSRSVSPVPIEWQGIRFYEVEYVYHPMGPAGQPNFAFPPILKNTKTGLSFYQLTNPRDSIETTNPPNLVYHLPYPAEEGATWTSQNKDIQVRLLNVDTLVTDFSSMMTFRVWRYNIVLHREVATDIYVIPGVALLRIEDMMFTYHTIGWNVR